MPIKFRCEHCRQLIGIAEIKAGSLVDCPTCGRTLRVPNKDGSVEPLPKPRVNLADNGLRRALDEIAQIGQTDETRSLTDEQARSQSASVTGLSPTAETAPPPTEQRASDAPPDRQANSIALEPLPPMKVVDPPAPRPAATTPQTVSGKGKAPPEQFPTEFPVFTLDQYGQSKEGSRSSVSLLVLIIACIVSLVVGLAVGYIFGRNSAARPATVVPESPDKPPPKPVAESTALQITGRLTYRDAKEKLQPDVGACVLLLPTKPDAKHKLSIIGLRPSDDDVARQAAIRSLEEQGGRLAQADDDGEFKLEVPGKGDYQLLALSHFKGRASEDEGNRATLETLAKFFDRPNQLVGQLVFELKTIKHPGSGEVKWDCTFEDDAKK